MSIVNLAFFWLSMCNPTEKLAIARAFDISRAVTEAINIEGDILEEHKNNYLLLLRMAYLESRGDYRISTVDGDYGIMQVRNPNLYGFTVIDVTSDMVTSFRAGIRVLKIAKENCGGTVQNYLGAYATGKCGGAPKLVKKRCEFIGICNQR